MPIMIFLVFFLGLLTELEEIRAQREHLGVQADNVTRVQIKQLSEHQNNIRTLEVWHTCVCFVVVVVCQIQCLG